MNDWREIINLPIIVPENSGWNVDELERILRLAIKDCVHECLEKDGAIHTSLSGGLDSSFCTWMIRDMFYPYELHVYTIGGSERHPDIIFAREAAVQLSYVSRPTHHEFIPNKNEIAEARKEFKKLFSDLPVSNLVTFMLYRFVASSHTCPHSIIAHDGIDELLGGYPAHRWTKGKPERRALAFKDHWARLPEEHLIPLERIADHFGIAVIFPYLQKEVVEYITRIPIEQRTSEEVSKIPLRNIAIKYLPMDIVRRDKRGLYGALDKY